MTWNIAMHGIGIACLLTMGGLSLGIIADTLIQNWSRIWPRACGEIIVGDGPVSPTASVLPLRTSSTPLRAVEAGAQPTYSKRVA